MLSCKLDSVCSWLYQNKYNEEYETKTCNTSITCIKKYFNELLNSVKNLNFGAKVLKKRKDEYKKLKIYQSAMNRINCSIS